MMKVILFLAALGAATACTPTFFSGELAHHGSRHLLAEAGAWNYNKNGADWPGVCGTGKIQSPIAFATEKLDVAFPENARAKLNMGTAKGVKVINTGTAVQLEWDSIEGVDAAIPVVGNTWGKIFDAKSEADVKDVKLIPVKPLQLHWHQSAEHLVDGETNALELHIVTAVDNTTGVEVPEQCNQQLCLAVFGTRLNVNADPAAAGDATYQKVIDNLPKGVGKDAATKLDWNLDLNTLLPAEKDYATYFGSLTAPPCSEGVHWHVFLDSKSGLSAAQLDAFQAATATVDKEGHQTGARITNRQVMPLNGRTVFVSEA